MQIVRNQPFFLLTTRSPYDVAQSTSFYETRFIDSGLTIIVSLISTKICPEFLWPQSETKFSQKIELLQSTISESNPINLAFFKSNTAYLGNS